MKNTAMGAEMDIVIFSEKSGTLKKSSISKKKTVVIERINNSSDKFNLLFFILLKSLRNK